MVANSSEKVANIFARYLNGAANEANTATAASTATTANSYNTVDT